MRKCSRKVEIKKYDQVAVAVLNSEELSHTLCGIIIFYFFKISMYEIDIILPFKHMCNRRSFMETYNISFL